MFCISVYKTTSKHLLLSAMFPYAKEQTRLDKPCANLKIGAKTAHGMLKLRCGIIVPAPCLALLQIQTKTQTFCWKQSNEQINYNLIKEDFNLVLALSNLMIHLVYKLCLRMIFGLPGNKSNHMAT